MEFLKSLEFSTDNYCAPCKNDILHKFEILQQQIIKNAFSVSAIVVVSFFLCWAPFHAQRLGYIYFADSQFKETFEAISDELM